MTILSHISRHIQHPDLRAKLDDDATFADLGINPVDAWGIAVDIEEELGRELDWSRVERWACVRDVVETVEGVVV